MKNDKKNKSRIKISIDMSMMIILLLLMAYSLVGEAIHEWLGIIMFILIIAHSVFTINWFKKLHKGKYTLLRCFQIVINIAMLLSFVALLFSGIMMSKHAFSFLNTSKGDGNARIVHMMCGYWVFILVSIHIGVYINLMRSTLNKALKIGTPKKKIGIIGSVILIVISLYGVLAFKKREIGMYMLFKTQYVFFDFNEPLIYFFADYISVMILFASIGHMVCLLLKKIDLRLKAED